MPVKGLLERLSDGESLIVGEGYVFELERRGFLTSGLFAPEVVLENPEVVRALHEEFVHAGSDVVEAFTYYGHRSRMRLIDREVDLERLNRKALEIARDVADRTGTLMAGSICNTTVYQPDNEETIAEAEHMFKEQIEWAVEGGADFIIAETFMIYGEARLALECIKKYGNGLPAVITMRVPLVDKLPYNPDECVTYERIPLVDALVKLERAGAAVVGLNCCMGPQTMWPLIERAKQACKGPVAALPVPFHTDERHPTWYDLTDPSGKSAFFFELATSFTSRNEISEFARKCKQIGVEYIGLCCGSSSNYLRVVAEAYGRTPPASRYRPNEEVEVRMIAESWKKHK